MEVTNYGTGNENDPLRCLRQQRCSIRWEDYHCAACGTDSDAPMSAADLAVVNRIAALGGDNEELTRLRRQYRNLDITSWDSENRLQMK